MELKPRELLSRENIPFTSGIFVVDGVEIKDFGNGPIEGLNLTDSNDPSLKYWYGIGKVMSNRLSAHNLKPQDLIGKKIKIGVESVKFKKYGKKDVLVIQEVLE